MHDFSLTTLTLGIQDKGKLVSRLCGKHAGGSTKKTLENIWLSDKGERKQRDCLGLWLFELKKVILKEVIHVYNRFSFSALATCVPSLSCHIKALFKIL